MRYRAPGNSRKMNRRELNEVSASLGRLRGIGSQFDPTPGRNDRLVLIRNDTGAAVRRFETLCLGNLLWTLDDDGTSDVVFHGLKSDPNKPTIVMVEDVDKDQCGYGLIEGLAVAWVTKGSGNRCTPSDTENMMVPSRAGRYVMIGTPDANDPKLVAVILVSEGTSLFRFTLLEDVNGIAEDKYRADIYTMAKSAVEQKAELIDTFGWMSDLQLRAGDVGLCSRDGGEFYYVTSDCGSLGDCKDGPFIGAGDAATGVTGQTYSWSPSSSGTAVTKWEASDLPPGLSIDQATGTISGTPTEAGEFLVGLTATADDGCVATKIVKLKVEAPPTGP